VRSWAVPAFLLEWRWFVSTMIAGKERLALLIRLASLLSPRNDIGEISTVLVNSAAQDAVGKGITAWLYVPAVIDKKHGQSVLPD